MFCVVVVYRQRVATMSSCRSTYDLAPDRVEPVCGRINNESDIELPTKDRME